MQKSCPTLSVSQKFLTLQGQELNGERFIVIYQNELWRCPRARFGNAFRRGPGRSDYRSATLASSPVPAVKLESLQMLTEDL